MDPSITSVGIADKGGGAVSVSSSLYTCAMIRSAVLSQDYILRVNNVDISHQGSY